MKPPIITPEEERQSQMRRRRIVELEKINRKTVHDLILFRLQEVAFDVRKREVQMHYGAAKELRP